MAKLIKGSKKNYTVIDNTIFKDTRLSLKDKGLFCQMISLPDNWNFSIKGITALCDDGKDSIRAGMENLEKYGYLTRKQARDKGGSFSGYDYYIYHNPADNPDYDPLVENPQMDEKDNESPLSENPTTGNPTSANPTTVKPASVKPSSDNPPQYSTKESSTKESSTDISVTVTDADHLFSSEEIESWSYEEFYSHLNNEQYEALNELLKKSMAHEIHSSKDSLISFFKKMMIGGWKDSEGKAIRNIVAYVTTIFNAETERNIKKHKELEEEEDRLPVYDTSKNPPFDEERFRELMELRDRKTREEK